MRGNKSMEKSEKRFVVTKSQVKRLVKKSMEKDHLVIAIKQLNAVINNMGRNPFVPALRAILKDLNGIHDSME